MNFFLGTGTPIVLADGQQPTQVVGTDPFGDGADATYVRCYGSSGTIPRPPRGQAHAFLETLDADIEPEDLILRVRASALLPGSTSAALQGVEMMYADGTELFFSFQFAELNDVPLDGLIYERTLSAQWLDADFSGGGFYYDTWVTALKSGNAVLRVLSTQGQISTPAPDMAMTYYSFTLEVVVPEELEPTGEADLVIRRRFAPARRS